MSHPSCKGAGRSRWKLCREWMAWINRRKIMRRLMANRVQSCCDPPAMLPLVETILVLEIWLQSHLYNALTVVNYRTEFCWEGAELNQMSTGSRGIEERSKQTGRCCGKLGRTCRCSPDTWRKRSAQGHHDHARQASQVCWDCQG